MDFQLVMEVLIHQRVNRADHFFDLQEWSPVVARRQPERTSVGKNGRDFYWV